jgi:hypothetical protein
MIEAFSTGFYNALIADSALQTKLGGSSTDYKIYNTLAPQTSSCPYIVFGVLTDTPMGTFTYDGAIEDMTFYINVFSETGVENILEIVDLIATAMDDASLTITGYMAMKCMREYVGSVSYDSDTETYQVSMRYRVQGSL